MYIDEQKIKDAEYRLLSGTLSSGDSIASILARVLASDIFDGLEVVLYFGGEGFKAQRKEGMGSKVSIAPLSNDFSYYEKPFIEHYKSKEFERFKKYFYATEDSWVLKILPNKTQKLMDLFILVKHEQKGFTPKIIKSSRLHTNSFFSLVLIASSLRMQRDLGELTYEVFKFCRTHDQVINTINVKEIKLFIKQISAHPPSVRKSAILKHLVFFYYNSIVIAAQFSSEEQVNSMRSLVKESFTELSELILEAMEQDKERHALLSSLLLLMKTISITLDIKHDGVDSYTNEYEVLSRNNQFDSISPWLLMYQASRLFFDAKRGKTLDTQFEDFQDFKNSHLKSYIKLVNDNKINDLLKSEKELKFSGGECYESRLFLDRSIVILLFINEHFSEKKISEIRNKSTDSEFHRFCQYEAFVVQEVLRALEIKDVPYITRPLQFASCLLGLVKIHAEKVLNVKLPEELFSALESCTKEDNLAIQASRLEELQHVMDIYLNAFVLGEIELPEFEKSTTLMSLLANNKMLEKSLEFESDNLYNFQRCLVLATLFHDMGMVNHNDEISVGEFVSELTKKNVVEPVEMELFLAGNSDQSRHALFGAHKLYYMLLEHNKKFTKSFPVSEKSRYTFDHEEIIKPTIRAILFHNSSGINHSIGKTNDPLCVYLSLLDEVFNWEPSFLYDPVPRKSMISEGDLDFSNYIQEKSLPKIADIIEDVKINLEGHTLSFTELGADKVDTCRPMFLSLLTGTPYSAHKLHTSILQKAQSFGRFEDSRYVVQRENDKQDESTDIEKFCNWSPRMKLVVLDEKFPLTGVIQNIDEFMLDINDDTSSLVHDYIIETKIINNSLTVGGFKTPFANIDVRSIFGELEKAIIDKYYYSDY